jgi:hypothetical protein
VSPLLISADMYSHPVPSLLCAVSLPDSPWAYIRDFGHVLLTLGARRSAPARDEGSTLRMDTIFSGYFGGAKWARINTFQIDLVGAGVFGAERLVVLYLLGHFTL